MSENLFSDYEDDEDDKENVTEKVVNEEKVSDDKKEEKNEEPEDVNVIPSEVIADKENPYSSLNDDQQIILNDMANNFSIELDEIIKEFNRAYLDKSLSPFIHNKPRMFTLAKAIMKNILDEKAKVKTFTISPLGVNVFYSPASNQVISTLVALMQYDVTDKNGKTTMVKKRKAIKSFDKVGELNYQSLHKMIPFYIYETMLKRDKKDEFTLSEFTSFDHGSAPDGKMANLTDLEIYEKFKIKPFDSIHTAGMSKLLKDSAFPDPTDLKAVYVISEPFTSYNAPKDFKDVISISSKAIDFEGNSFTMRLPALPGFETMVSEFPKNQRISGIAIGTLHVNEKTGDTILTVYNFFPSEEGE